LGRAYEKGDGVRQNFEAALNWFRKAAAQGDGTAENNLGVMYFFGEGVPRDKEQSLHWYRLAAKHGNAEAMFNVGAAYFNGDGVGISDIDAYAWFLLAGDAGSAAGDDAARRSAATMPASDKAHALMHIADMYEKGDDLPQNYQQTLRWLRKAAEMDAGAKVVLAEHLVNGPKAMQNPAEAFQMCSDAAKDSAVGQYCLGTLYLNGLGVAQDPTSAVKWYKKAADWRYPPAMLALADLYETGKGTPVDRPEAFMLLWFAANMRVQGASAKVVALWKAMDQNELAKTRQKLRNARLDPDKVFEVLKSYNPS
jgi:uncharacterized protein